MDLSEILAIAAIMLATIVVIFEAAFFIVRALHARAAAKDHAELAEEMRGFLEEIRRLTFGKGGLRNQGDKVGDIAPLNEGPLSEETISSREAEESQLTSPQIQLPARSPFEPSVEDTERTFGVGGFLGGLAMKDSENAVEVGAQAATGGPEPAELSEWEKRILIGVALRATLPLTATIGDAEAYATAERLEALGLIKGFGEPPFKTYRLTELGYLKLENIVDRKKAG